MLTRICLAILLLCPLARAGGAATLRYQELLSRAWDLESLALRPEPGERAGQFSSRDPSSRLGPAAEELSWRANDDRGHFLRHDPQGAVLAEMRGPGMITRIWMATPQGRLQVFVDGARRPTFAADLATLAAGRVPGLPTVFAGSRGQGFNCYLPMPYQRSCRVVVADPGDLYYSVAYRTLPPGRAIEPFHWPLRPAEQAALQAAVRRLRAPATPPASGLQRGRGRLAPGATLTLARLSGPAAITYLALLPRLPSGPGADDALAGLVLGITFDGAATPQVWAPAGHFFGSAPGLNAFQSYPAGITSERLWCRWYMPFARSATVQVRNLGTRAVSLGWEVARQPLGRPFVGLMHFHAAYRRDYPAREFDWPVLAARGPGRYLGMSLAVWNPDRTWWGEGDEKIWLEGERFPSWWGTGTEDYFGYAWGHRHPFSHPCHALTLCQGPRHANWTSAVRWHLLDNIPFSRRLRLALENYAQNKDYAAVTYWYAMPGAGAPAPPPDRIFLVRHQPVPPYREPGAREGERLRVLQVVGAARLSRPEMGDYSGRWSGEHQLWLQATGAQAAVELALPVPRRGRYALEAYLTHGPEYGRVRLYLAGRRVGEEACRDERVRRVRVPLGDHYLRGPTTLRLQVAGRGRAAGLDCLVLRPAPGGFFTRVADWLRGLLPG